LGLALVVLALVVPTAMSKLDDKISICHVPDLIEDPDEETHIITIARQALEAHLSHGDYEPTYGECIPPLP
jgi:hypothetical protein